MQRQPIGSDPPRRTRRTGKISYTTARAKNCTRREAAEYAWERGEGEGPHNAIGTGGKGEK